MEGIDILKGVGLLGSGETFSLWKWVKRVDPVFE